MRILTTNQWLDRRGGSETYLEVVVPELVKLGHDVTAWAPELGVVAERLRELGCHVTDDLSTVDAVDVIHAQHGSAALLARERFPTVPMVFVCHSWALDIEDPPPAAQPGALVALNAVVEARLRASALGERVAIHRLRQPVTVNVSEPSRVQTRARPQRAVAVSRRLSSRADLLADACQRRGISFDVVGADGGVDNPEPMMMRSDIVFATGRTALEAMALGRATFIFDEIGMSGFVTDETYPALEGAGFAPVGSMAVTAEVLDAELATYDAMLGPGARELAARNHFARAHAMELVELYRSLMEAPVAPHPDPASLDELARLTQQVFELELRARSAEWARAALERAMYDLQEELDRLHASRSWRVTKPLRALHRRTDDHR